jgi:hypothetical protein
VTVLSRVCRCGWMCSVLLAVAATEAQGSMCTVTGAKPGSGLAIENGNDAMVVTWDGAGAEQIRARFAIVNGTPTIAELAVRSGKGAWKTLGQGLTPEFRVASGYRRLDQEALPALEQSVGKVDQAVLDHYKWDAFWDAPLHLPGGEMAHHGATPAPKGIPGTDQPGLPRKESEVHRATAAYHATGCEAEMDGGRLEVRFPGVEMGIFNGRLQYTIYKGSDLMRMEVIAKTEEKSVAYKYDAGLAGLGIKQGTKLMWRDTANTPQEFDFSAEVNKAPAVVKAANRVLTYESGAGNGTGSIATFPPPHNFFWVREIDTNLGYTWYRKDSDRTFSLGVCQAEDEQDPAYAGRGAEDRRQNFALYNARPGTEQRMPVYFVIQAGDGRAATEAALAYTRKDHYEHLDGYWVMARHFHTSPLPRMLGDAGFDGPFPDFELARATGVNIFGPVGGGALKASTAVMGPDQNAPTRTAAAMAAARLKGNDDERLKEQAAYYDMVRLQARPDFLVMPDEELFTGPIAGHNDVLVSHPVYWTNRRLANQPFVEEVPKYGKVYHIGTPEDLLKMTHEEDMLIFTPHPDTKASAGYPRAFKDTAYFQDENYKGIGWRWGMGVDRSEKRLCDYRCMPLFDEMNNWVADLPGPPKYMDAITETYEIGPGDDFYGNSPVTYVHTEGTPTADNLRPVVDAMRKGEFFATSGEVLIPSYSISGTGAKRVIHAEVQWTFPLEFAEVVWGDGVKTDRQIIKLTEMGEFGKHRFDLPFDATGKKWVRFAVWDSAGNGGLVQPVKLR